jgi:hypothetical protein
MKLSLSIPNAANFVAGHVAASFRSLAIDPVPGVWFTGSNVWSFVLGMDPRPGSDWDIFVIGENDSLAEMIARTVVLRLGLLNFPACPTDKKQTGGEKTISAGNVPRLPRLPNVDRYNGGDGFCYATDAGDIDVWISTASDAAGELRSYPSNSHAHCRAAFSFSEGLVVMPNERAIHDDRRD